MTYFSLAEPILTYAVVFWGGFCQETLRQLEDVEKPIIKIIENTNKCYPTLRLFENTTVLQIRQLSSVNVYYKNHAIREESFKKTSKFYQSI